MSTEDDTSALSGFGADYQSVFIDAWPPCLGGILLVLVIVGLMIDGACLLIWHAPVRCNESTEGFTPF